MMALRSIRARLTAAFSLCLAVLIAAAVFGLIWYSRHSAERSADNLLISVAKRVMLESSDPKEPSNPQELIEEGREGLEDSDLTISVVDRNKRVIGRSQSDAPGLTPVDGSKWRVFTSRLKNGDYVVVGMPWSKTYSALRYQGAVMTWLGLFIILAASAGAWLLVGRTLTPISALARQAKTSSADNLSLSLESPSQDREMLELVRTLNGLLSRITETTAAKGRFYSAASHELRTPLQALSGHLELALSRDRTRDEYKAAVEEAHKQAKRLVSLVRALLFLYQLDTSKSVPPKEPVDLVELCKRSLAHYQPLTEKRGVQTSIYAPKEAEIAAAPDHIDMLVRNLVENALKYASDNGRVDVTITKDTSAMRLEIANDCSLPLDWKPETFFEPFSRPDPSRNTRTGGTGLGLAICKSIADANGWQFNIASSGCSFKALLLISGSKESA